MGEEHGMLLYILHNLSHNLKKINNVKFQVGTTLYEMPNFGQFSYAHLTSDFSQRSLFIINMQEISAKRIYLAFL